MSFRRLLLAMVIAGALGSVAWIAWQARDFSQMPTVQSEPASSATLQAFDELSEQAQAAIANQRDLSAILAKTQAMIEKTPTFWPARRLATLLLMQQGRDDEAYTQALKVIELEPAQAEMIAMAGMLALKRKELVQAQQHFARAAALEPGNARFGLQHAQSLIAGEQLDEARKQVEHVLALDSSHGRAYAMLADIHARQNRIDPALTAIRQAIKQTPATQDAERTIYVRQYARLLRQDGEPARSLAVLRTLSLDEQFDAPVMAELAQCWAMLDQPIRAAKHYEQAMYRNPADQAAARLSAQWYDRCGLPDQARQMRLKARQINPATR